LNHCYENIIKVVLGIKGLAMWQAIKQIKS
jgi:hypothetical protein